MPTIIVTDLTHFTTPNSVCLAGIDVNSHECLRPLPYLSPNDCVDITPGVAIELNGRSAGAQRPHCEDYVYTDYNVIGYSGQSFRNVLENTASRDIESGFGVGPIVNRCIPAETPPSHSIITVNILRSNVTAVPDQYRERIKFHVTDASGTEYSFVPCAGLRWYNSAVVDKVETSTQINAYISQHESVYMRIGISRVYEAAGRNGFWLQINGIYGL